MQVSQIVKHKVDNELLCLSQNAIMTWMLHLTLQIWEYTLQPSTAADRTSYREHVFRDTLSNGNLGNTQITSCRARTFLRRAISSCPYTTTCTGAWLSSASRPASHSRRRLANPVAFCTSTPWSVSPTPFFLAYLIQLYFTRLQESS